MKGCCTRTGTTTSVGTGSTAGYSESRERKKRNGVHSDIPGRHSCRGSGRICNTGLQCAVADVEFPGHVKPCLEGTKRQARDLFAKIPGLTKLACHQIDTLGPPARVPPRRIPAHFQQEVQEQINDMLKKGIIVESSSSWLAPAVYTRKKTGEIRLYREVNKRTKKDAYPLPLINEVQDRLAGATIFSKLDLQCGYWQIPVDPKDQEKTAFSPGPGMGLFQFTRMPFGLCGAPSTFQRLMDLVMRGLPFVTTYLDDVLNHSANEELHKSHLQQTFQRLREAGLTLRGNKCEIGMNQVTYLGHTFAREGMAPDGSKVDAVVNWPQPRDEAEVRRFLGLSSYYRKYIDKFADIAAPLHQLTQKDALFQWTQECEESFRRLKACLTKAPVLSYPSFGTEASNNGVTDRCQQYRWLAVPKMEGLLCRWALAIQEFSFDTVYRKGIANGNADALSRREPEMETPHAAMTTVYAGFTPEELKKAQKQDDALQQLYTACTQLATNPTQKVEATTNEMICPVMVTTGEALHQKAMSLCHDSPTAGHQGTLKTWERIRQEA
ncbi:hypothetical protein EMCRGX_G007894 [Ephydatia muelleri]